MNPTQQDLKDAGCWFDTDKVGGREMTAFKREARWRQHRWAVDELAVQSFGSHPGRRKDPEVPSEDIPNGTKLLDHDAAAGLNFLTPAIYQIAKQRVDQQQQDHETLDRTRLYRDLLSSMPMAFNLFGEAALSEHEVSRRSLAQLFGVTADTATDIVFEWSPGRRNEKYTRDRTAFDVALRLGEPGTARTVIGIETKYHEHPKREAQPSKAKADAYQRYEAQTDFLVNVAESSRVFQPGWRDEVLDTDLRQIWRDHLLALSMRAHPAEWTPLTRYVLLYPSHNVSFHDAARRYVGLLIEGDTSFRALTLDDVVDAAFAHGGATKGQFVRRYLWWVEAA